MVNMNISPSGVVIGAMPPVAPGGRLPITAGQALADLLAGPVDVGAVLEIEVTSVSAYFEVERSRR
jgi:hypothetical protein